MYPWYTHVPVEDWPMRVGRITRLASSSWFSPIDWPRLSYCVWVASCPVGQQDDKAIVSSPCGFSHFICMKFSLPCFHSCHTGSVSQTPNMVARMTKLHHVHDAAENIESRIWTSRSNCFLLVFFLKVNPSMPSFHPCYLIGFTNQTRNSGWRRYNFSVFHRERAGNWVSDLNMIPDPRALVAP